MLNETAFYSYEIKTCDTDNMCLFNVHFNPNHSIFNGHFPGNPVVPGVCMTHIVSELLTIYLQKTIKINKINIIKFLKIIDPRIDENYEFRIQIQHSDNAYICDSSIYLNNEAYFKMKSSYSII